MLPYIVQSVNIVHDEAVHLLVNCTRLTNKRTILSYPILSYPIHPILSYPIHPIISSPLLSSPLLSSPLLSYPILSYPILSYPILSYPIISYHIISYHIISYHIISYPILSYLPGSNLEVFPACSSDSSQPYQVRMAFRGCVRQNYWLASVSVHQAAKVYLYGKQTNTHRHVQVAVLQ